MSAIGAIQQRIPGTAILRRLHDLRLQMCRASERNLDDVAPREERRVVADDLAQRLDVRRCREGGRPGQERVEGFFEEHLAVFGHFGVEFLGVLVHHAAGEILAKHQR